MANPIEPQTTPKPGASVVPGTTVGWRLGYVPALDGIRGLALLLVMGNHIPLRKFGSLLPGGFVGVDVFFVLSGFLITTLLLQEFDQTRSISLRNFYIRRALRLGPALIVLLVVDCLLSFVLFDRAHAWGNCRDALIALCYASNWVRVLTPNQLGILAHTWSLSCEEQFYLVWPLVLLTLMRLTKKRYFVTLVASGVALLSWWVSIHLTGAEAGDRRLCFGLDARANTLMIGCILSVAFSSGLLTGKAKGLIQKLLLIAAPVSLVALVAFAIVGAWMGRSFFYFGFPLIAIMAAVLILDVLASPRSLVRWLMTMKWLVWIGTISYGLYLWHWPIYWGMHGFGFKGWTVVLVGTPITFLAVLLSYYGLERPILKLKKRYGSMPETIVSNDQPRWHL